MTAPALTLEDLVRLLRESAGEAAPFDGELLDAELADLGYDSLALLETTGRITRDLGITFDEELAVTAPTVRDLLAVINGEATAVEPA
ncbi:acyl carrier protein [Actinokineospora sp. G85]|uniref:acyl carrier protein n=1 Tax=Actinokineospora sp. G85 TaxID=3406626 RepID=UPI003C74D3BF